MRMTATSCVTRGRKRITPHIGVPQTALWRAERAARPTVPSLACRNLYLYFAAGYGDCVEPVGLNGCASWCGCEPHCSAACTPSPGSWQVRRLRLRLLQQPLGQRKLQPAASRTRAALRQIWQVYSTSDLKTWTFHGNVLPLGPPRPNATLFSPKAVFNAGTGLWCERKVEARLCRNFETSLSACRRAGWKSRRELWGVAVRIYGKRWETLYVSHNVGHCSLGAACSAPLRAAGFCGTT